MRQTAAALGVFAAVWLLIIAPAYALGLRVGRAAPSPALVATLDASAAPPLARVEFP